LKPLPKFFVCRAPITEKITAPEEDGSMKTGILLLGLRLDYLSCLLTVGSTILIGRRSWVGWVVAAANSLIICFIGLRTAQLGFIPANLFCIVLYAFNLQTWRRSEVSCSGRENK
jgi:hypothetical protein